ncbi:MAG: hypothetical protein JRI23_36180 [Deltaproteobacteria bacterium]|jgi:hypothetical protein|nr:hypothetical protein [Deltaproteobacteria bacterium]MBW2537788.1 hypothetical protein [Deltaproteobacteria bacterium]
MRRIALAVVVLCSVLLGWAHHGRAAPTRNSEQGKKAALPFAQKGLDLFDAGRYVEAIAEFQRAEDLFHAPTHLKYMAEAHERLGQLLEAQRHYGEAIADQLPESAPEVFQRVQTEAREALTNLVKRIPTLEVEVQGIDRELVRITVDGENWPSWWERPRRFNPGKHEVMAAADGYLAVVRSVTLAEGARDRLVIDMSTPDQAPTPEEPPASPGGSYVPAIVAFGIGGVGLLVGAITGGMSLGKVSELDERCPDKSCPAEDEELADEAKLLGNVSTAGFVIGGIGVAAGVALLIWRPGGDEPSETAFHIRPRIGPGAFYLEGAF